jgi:hypothetical protein
MDLRQINEMLARDPFKPFRIKLADGTGYDVRNPGLVVPMQTMVLIAFPADDRFAVVSYFQITALETLRNGRGKRRGRKTA